MHHQPKRTCIGCRQVFGKNEVIRIVAGPKGALIDYREKLPGRAAYVCPRPECIQKALVRENLSRALHVKTAAPEFSVFLEQIAGSIVEKIRSLIAMAAKAGSLAAGASAVNDALQKGRVEMLVFASDLSGGTRGKLLSGATLPARQATLFTRDEMGQMVGRELVGVVGIIEKGFADAVGIEYARLKGLLNKHL